MQQPPCLGLNDWLVRLSEAQLPALATVVKSMTQLAGNSEDVSVQQMAEVLLRDASLTAQVLKVASSAYYNPARESIKTISRAIVLIGFENVRLIALSLSLIDHLLANSPREQLIELLARSFHAAVQARNLAGYTLVNHQEEVFIAALLNHLGELAFWGAGGAQADELARQLSLPGAELESCARAVLGVSFRQLSQGLMKAWGIGTTALLALDSRAQSDPAVRAVSLGVRISRAALSGWDSEAMAGLVNEAARFAGISESDALAQILSSAEESIQVASTFGASKLCARIPSSDPAQLLLQQQERKARLLQADLLILQQCLQELGAMAQRRESVTAMLDTLLRGLHQGAGLERVMVAVLADGQSCFRCKGAAGENQEHWQNFILPVDQPAQAHLFSYVLRQRETLWMGVPASQALSDLVTAPLRQWLGEGMFFIAPLLAGKRPIGVLYADSRLSGRALRHEQFVAFTRFAQSAQRALEALSQGK